jgi:hypothetical protein
MTRTTDSKGRAIREPVARTIHDVEAAEREPECLYCGVPVTNPGDYCSEACADLAARDRAADAWHDEEVAP